MVCLGTYKVHLKKLTLNPRPKWCLRIKSKKEKERDLGRWHENALQWQKPTWVHGTKHGECGWIQKREEESVEDEIEDKGLTMQDAFGPVKNFYLFILRPKESWVV